MEQGSHRIDGSRHGTGTGAGRQGARTPSRPDPGRPAWPRGWVVLAVALGLMALVAALASTGPRLGPRPLAAHRSGADRLPPPAHRTSPTTTPTTTATSVATSGGSPSSSAGSAGSTGSGGDAGVPTTVAPAPLRTAGDGTTGDSTTTTAPAAAPRPPAATGPTTVAGTDRPYPGPGNIAAPTVSASFPADPGPAVTATVTWAGPSTLQLSVACPGGPSTVRAGMSPLSVEVDDRGGTTPCQVVVSVVAPTWSGADAVAYTLSIAPPAGS